MLDRTEYDARTKLFLTHLLSFINWIKAETSEPERQIVVLGVLNACIRTLQKEMASED